MRYLIIGLGIYGSNLAIDLTNLGNEVIGADIRTTTVENIKDYISASYIIDSTDEAALSALPLNNVDLVIVAIGENFGASIKTVALLKKLGIKHIYARSIDTLHEAILEGMHVDRIIKPEQRAALDLTRDMALGQEAEAIEICPDNYVMTFKAPDYFIGLKYSGLNLEHEFNLRLIAATRAISSKNIIGITHSSQHMLDKDADADNNLIVENGDKFVCLGSAAAFRTMMRRCAATTDD